MMSMPRKGLCCPPSCGWGGNRCCRWGFAESTRSVHARVRIRQIATGMAYLEDKRVVHRDLASRNVLVANGKTVKISDVGLRRMVEDYYFIDECDRSRRRGSCREQWPLKWFAPECIEFSKFTSQSDVWSFGVTAWECMTFGKKPFKGWTGQMVVQHVIMERRCLPHPPKCPQPLFDLLGRCWQHEPDDRPRFKEIPAQITVMLRQLAGGQQYSSSAQSANADQEFYDIIPDPAELRYEEEEERAHYVNDGAKTLAAKCSILLRDLKFGEAIGDGSYGSVTKGQFKGQVVAIKKLKVGNEYRQAEFIGEADLMAKLKCDFLVPFYGLCIAEGGKLYAVIEFQSLGALDTHLARQKPATKAALKFAAQVAEGMRYMEKERVVHRDLAARNVLVNTPTKCKIGDFSLARALGHESDYYRTEQKGRWPIKWYAPECLYTSTFNSASDVWSFGVTMWEIINNGDRPYPGMRGRQVLEFVETGKRLQVPPQVRKDFPVRVVPPHFFRTNPCAHLCCN